MSFAGFVSSYGGYALGGPIVHWAHRNVGKGFASLGINVAAIMTGTFIGFAAAGGHEGSGRQRAETDGVSALERAEAEILSARRWRGAPWLG